MESSEYWGVIEAQRRYRGWLPHLTKEGQRYVFGGLLAFYSMDGTTSPSAPQIAELFDMHVQSVRRSLRQLEQLGAVIRVGSRPRLDSAGVAHGGTITIWSFTKCAPGSSGGNPQVIREPVPGKPKSRSRSASEGSPLRVEVLEGEDLSDSQLDNLIREAGSDS